MFETKKEFYRCYSNDLKNYLMSNDLRYILIAKDIKSNAVFWLFKYDKNCENLINSWELSFK